MRGPDKRPRLKPEEVRCAECQQPMLRAAAVVMNGESLHPRGCFGPALERWSKAIDDRLQKHVAAFALSIEMESVTPTVARQLGQLAGDVLRARRASR